MPHNSLSTAKHTNQATQKMGRAQGCGLRHALEALRVQVPIVNCNLMCAKLLILPWDPGSRVKTCRAAYIKHTYLAQGIP